MGRTRHTRGGAWVDRGRCVGRRALMAPGKDEYRCVVPEAESSRESIKIFMQG